MACHNDVRHAIALSDCAVFWKMMHQNKFLLDHTQATNTHTHTQATNTHTHTHIREID